MVSSSRGSSSRASAASSAAGKGKKKSLFSLKSLKRGTASGDGGGSWKAGRRRKISKASFALVPAKYQKGEKKDQLTGNVIARAAPRFGQNEEFKKNTQPLLLAEPWRFNDELKVYTAKVYNAVQAQKVLDAMRELPECEADLPEAVDEAAFADATPAHVDVFPMEVEDADCYCVAGRTFPFKDELTTRGFKFSSQGGTQYWYAPEKDLDISEVAELFQEYGFTVTVHDGVEEDEDDE